MVREAPPTPEFQVPEVVGMQVQEFEEAVGAAWGMSAQAGGQEDQHIRPDQGFDH